MVLLRDVFDYGYDEIAEIVGKSADNVRRWRSGRAPHRRAAAPVRDLPRTARQAGPPVLRRRPGRRPERTRVTAGLGEGGRSDSGSVTTPRGGQWQRRGAAARRRGSGDQRLDARVAGGQIHGVKSIVNPEKLAHLGPVADVRALPPLRTGRSSREFQSGRGRFRPITGCSSDDSFLDSGRCGAGRGDRDRRLWFVGRELHAFFRRATPRPLNPLPAFRRWWRIPQQISSAMSTITCRR